MAEAMRKGYRQLFALKENAHTLKREELDGLITQITGLSKDNGTARAIAKTFEALKGFASFDETGSENRSSPEGALAKIVAPAGTADAVSSPPPPMPQIAQEIGMNLSYTINLNLPETTNIAVFNAIFSAMKAHLLKR
jgi:hypothetical protein